MRKTNIKKHQRQNDRFIMDDIHKYTSSIAALKLLNVCRFYIQITFLSDITNLAGDKIIQGTTSGQKQDLPTSKLRWPTQRKPNEKNMASMGKRTFNNVLQQWTVTQT